MKPRPMHVPPESHFHCSAEWHLHQMKSRFALVLYSWALRLCRKSGVFSASAENVALYFDVNRKTVLRALEALTDIGFFAIERAERFRPCTYTVIDHRVWAVRNPGRCVEQVTFPWTGQGDELGRLLYAISGQRVRFFPDQTTGLRNLGLSDEQIVEHFRNFMVEADYEGRKWKYAYYDFLDALRALTSSIESHPKDTGRVPSVSSVESLRSPVQRPTRGTQVLEVSGRNRANESKPTIPAASQRKRTALEEGVVLRKRNTSNTDALRAYTDKRLARKSNGWSLSDSGLREVDPRTTALCEEISVCIGWPYFDPVYNLELSREFVEIACEVFTKKRAGIEAGRITPGGCCCKIIDACMERNCRYPPDFVEHREKLRKEEWMP